MPTLGQLRERLADCIRSGYGDRVIDLQTEETLRDRLEAVIAEREIAAGIRHAPHGPQPHGTVHTFSIPRTT